MDETSVSLHKYINVGTEKKGWGYRHTSNQNKGDALALCMDFRERQDSIVQLQDKLSCMESPQHLQTRVHWPQKTDVWLSLVPQSSTRTASHLQWESESLDYTGLSKKHTHIQLVYGSESTGLGDLLNYMRSWASFPSPAHLSCHNSSQETNRKGMSMWKENLLEPINPLRRVTYMYVFTSDIKQDTSMSLLYDIELVNNQSNTCLYVGGGWFPAAS